MRIAARINLLVIGSAVALALAFLLFAIHRDYNLAMDQLLEDIPSGIAVLDRDLTVVDQNRAYAQLAQKAGVAVTDVSNVTIWGNHSATQYPDLFHCEVAGANAAAAVNDQAWINDDFIPTVQKRGAAIIDARGASSAASAANAAIDHMHDWALGSDAVVSMGVYSDGSYDIDGGLIYSYPVRCSGGDWQIEQGIEINDFSREKMDATATELAEERDAVAHLLP